MLKRTILAALLATSALSFAQRADACSLPEPPPPVGTIVGGTLNVPAEALPKDVALIFNARVNAVSLAQASSFFDVKVTAGGVDVPGALFETRASSVGYGRYAWRPDGGTLPVGTLSVSYKQATSGDRKQVDVTVREQAWVRPSLLGVALEAFAIEDPESPIACSQRSTSSCGNVDGADYRYGLKSGVTAGPPEGATFAMSIDASYIERTMVYELRDAQGKVLASSPASERGRAIFANEGAQVCAKVTDTRVDNPALVFAHPETCESTAGIPKDVSQVDLQKRKELLMQTCNLSQEQAETGINDANGGALGSSGCGCNTGSTNGSTLGLFGVVVLLLRNRKRAEGVR